MLCDLVLLLVMKTNLNLQWSCECSVSLFTLLDSVLVLIDFILSKLKIDKFQTELPTVVLNRRNIVEDFL